MGSRHIPTMAPSTVYIQAKQAAAGPASKGSAGTSTAQKRKRSLAKEDSENDDEELDAEDEEQQEQQDSEDDEEDEDDEVVVDLVSKVNGKGKGRAALEEQGDQDQDGRPMKKVFKQKTLVLTSRGITHRMRHLTKDLYSILPHSKMDAKLDTKHQLGLLNELADLSNCSSALFFEARRHADLYLWAALTPNGPSIRFQLLNAHTMDELKMTGNCLKGSRPIVVFDNSFDASPHWRLIKEVLMQVFAVPKSARRAKPFVDHVTSFSIADGKVWFKNYQIVSDAPLELDLVATAMAADPEAATSKSKKQKLSKNEEDNISMNEIGPRFVLEPIKIFEGSFGGAVVWENEAFVTPTAKSANAKLAKAAEYKGRKDAEYERKGRMEYLAVQEQEDRERSGKAALAKSKVFA